MKSGVNTVYLLFKTEMQLGLICKRIRRKKKVDFATLYEKLLISRRSPPLLSHGGLQ